MKRKYNTGIVERHTSNYDFLDQWLIQVFSTPKSLECCPNGSEGEE